jgi:hypothetical protein
VIIKDLTKDHVGLRLDANIESIRGWLPNILIDSVEHHDNDTSTLMFRWNDDPNPSNSKAGQFAIGVDTSSSLECAVYPQPDYT